MNKRVLIALLASFTTLSIVSMNKEPRVNQDPVERHFEVFDGKYLAQKNDPHNNTKIGVGWYNDNRRIKLIRVDAQGELINGYDMALPLMNQHPYEKAEITINPEDNAVSIEFTGQDRIPSTFTDLEI